MEGGNWGQRRGKQLHCKLLSFGGAGPLCAHAPGRGALTLGAPVKGPPVPHGDAPQGGWEDAQPLQEGPETYRDGVVAGQNIFLLFIRHLYGVGSLQTLQLALLYPDATARGPGTATSPSPPRGTGMATPWSRDMNTALLSSPQGVFLFFHRLKQQMYKHGPAGHEKRDLNCSGKGDATAQVGRSAQVAGE